MTDRIREILGWVRSENPGDLTNLSRRLNDRRLGGTGHLIILPPDQGFEYGPGRSSFPRDRTAGWSRLDQIIRIYKGETP